MFLNLLKSSLFSVALLFMSGIGDCSESPYVWFACKHFIYFFIAKPRLWTIPKRRVQIRTTSSPIHGTKYTCFTFKWSITITSRRGKMWPPVFTCGILTREDFIKACGDFGLRKIISSFGGMSSLGILFSQTSRSKTYL